MYAKALDPAYPTPRPTNAAGGAADVIRLLTLREFEASGPLSGLEVINRVAATARRLGLTPPGYPLLHGLTDEGLLEAIADRPRLYRATAAGVREAEALARRCWPRLRDEVARFGASLALASPKATDDRIFASHDASRPGH